MIEIEKLRHLFDEYKHRHDLVWRAIFQISVVVAVLSYLPYVDAVKGFRSSCWRFLLLVLPVMAASMAGFGIFVVKNELNLFWRAVVAYHHMQNEFLSTNIPDNLLGDVKHKVVHKHKDTFRTYCLFYMVMLFLLAAINVFVTIVWLWKPSNV